MFAIDFTVGQVGVGVDPESESILFGLSRSRSLLKMGRLRSPALEMLNEMRLYVIILRGNYFKITLS